MAGRAGAFGFGCVGVVLAAGAGTRYGMPKVLAEGGAWLRGAVAALRGGGCRAVIVTLGATGPDVAAVGLPEGARGVWVAEWATGMGASVRAGLRAAARSGAEYVAIMPVDTPDVGAEVVARVIAAAIDSPTGMARAVFRNTPGHPVVLEKRHWEPVYSAAQGNSGGRTYLRGNNAMVCVTCDDLATGSDRDYPTTTAR
ncbi:nucleotidyltransferase family protein [Nocardia panacis]|uniref:Nucleotidyltransferase family protein n=1 Tax=Nocardia panacis TaxID=2340916 RepID=A0A3A4KPW0_9NOCA|nr:nucleotidyltransferase family protein [Nocardia panacis]RJO76602.1 nucleotidyltransferase family protein [Nocardia panacis]